jgi:nucleotide-binding universal stress UspA family protein
MPYNNFENENEEGLGMESTIFRKIMVATDGLGEVRKAVDSAIEIAKLSDAKLYAVYVVAVRGYAITPSKDTEWEKAVKKQLIKEGKEATNFVSSDNIKLT